jgi:hypothetical protein
MRRISAQRCLFTGCGPSLAIRQGHPLYDYVLTMDAAFASGSKDFQQYALFSVQVDQYYNQSGYLPGITTPSKRPTDDYLDAMSGQRICPAYQNRQGNFSSNVRRHLITWERQISLRMRHSPN